MPTYGDETLHERYQREHADNLARLAKMTPEQIAEMELSLHNALAVVDQLRAKLEAMQGAGEAAAAPIEIELPTYHAQGMGCGLEDRGITDRYEAMAYGFQEGLDQMAAIIDSLGPLYASPVSAKPAIRIELVSVSPGSGLHIRVWNDLAGLEPGTYELYLPVQP